MTRPERRQMRNHVARSLAVISLLAGSWGQAHKRSDTLRLPDGKTLSAARSSASVNSLPATLVQSKAGRYVVSLSNGFGSVESGQRQSLSVLDTATNEVTDFPDNRLGDKAKQTYFLGLAFSGDENSLYASMASSTDAEGTGDGDTGNGVAVYSFNAGKIAPERFIKIPLQQLAPGKTAAKIIEKMAPGKLIPFPAGLSVIPATDGNSERLLVADNLSDDALLIDAANGHIIRRFDLATEKIVPGAYPYDAVVTHDGKRGYVSLWNASRVAELDLTSGAVKMIEVERPHSTIASGSHPTAMLLSKDGSRLYVALANRDEVAIVDTRQRAVVQRLSTKLPGQEYVGATPVALALSQDEKQLFVANAGTNSVGVFKLGAGSGNHAAGFIPTEWYPQALALRDGELIIASGKGRGTGPNGVIRKTPKARKPFPYILSLLRGSLARVKVPVADEQLKAMTAEVLANNHADRKMASIFPNGAHPIKHVIYIIKENRSYDQVFGDLKEANGDPSLVMYGEEITPNEHKLAREFGILDNFYDSGEVSGNGHNWSTAATSGDYLEKTIGISYRGLERNYDYEGEVNNRVPLNDDMPDINETGTGYIWSDVAAHHLTYRHYGEFVLTKWCNEKATDVSPMEGTPLSQGWACPKTYITPGEPLPNDLGLSGEKNPWPWPIPIIASNTATKPELRGHFDAKFPDFNLEYPDQLRADEFLREFKQFVKGGGKGRDRELPDYILLRLGNDHTSGTKAGVATPAAAVADNDLAVGRVVEAVSHSPYWDDTAILVLEDDAQDGPDHVDAHRSIALLISKYSASFLERPLVDSEFHCTVDMVRTLEALLGLPPMNSNDAHALPITSAFSGKGDHPAYEADYRNRDNGRIYQANSVKAPGAAKSAKMDFSHADRADTAVLNAILWRAAMGDKPMPATRGAATKVKRE